MNREYVEIVDNAYRVTGTRISLDSVVYAYWNGQSAESIAQSFPELSLEQVHGALAFYLANRAAIDVKLVSSRAEYDSLRAASRQTDPMFFQRLSDARRAETLTRP